MSITAPSILEYQSAVSDTGDITLTTGPATPDTAWLVAVHGWDYYQLSDGLQPTTDAGLGWTDAADDGDTSYGHPHTKIWVTRAPGGATAVRFTHPLDAGHHAGLFVVGGTSGVVAGLGGYAVVPTTDHTLPTLTAPAGAVPALMIASAITLTNGSTTVTYTPPAGWTERSETTRSPDPWSTMTVDTTVISAPGSTGTNTAVASSAFEYATAAILLGGVDTGAPPPSNAFRGWGIPL